MRWIFQFFNTCETKIVTGKGKEKQGNLKQQSISSQMRFTMLVHKYLHSSLRATIFPKLDVCTEKDKLKRDKKIK